MKIGASKEVLIMSEKMIEDFTTTKENDEKQNGYKYRLLLEYKEIIEKRVKLEKYIKQNENKTKDTIELEKIDLLIKELDILFRYEEIIFMRLKFELSK